MTYTREERIITSEQDWLKWRAEDITSTQISALFDLSPYHTKFELYHAKKNGLVLPFRDNERVRKGKRIEGYAANEIAMEKGLVIEPSDVYIRIPELRLGSSFDFFAENSELGRGILEIKAVDHFRHKANWSPDEIPPHIELQARFQMFLADREWCLVAAFTGIYDHHEYMFKRDRQYEEGFVAEAKKFWQAVETGDEPEPDFTRDGEVIAALYRDASKPLLNMIGDGEFEDLLWDYQRYKAEAKNFSERAEAAKAEIHFRLKDNIGAFTDKMQVSAKYTKGSEGILITQDMVGQRIGARAGYRQCIVKETL